MSEPEHAAAELDVSTAPPSRARDRSATVVLALACVLAVVAMLATFARGQLLDTPRWVDTSSALLADPAVQKATAAYLADQLTSSPQTVEAIRKALPDRFDGAAGPAVGLLGDAAEKAALRGLRSGAFQKAWRRSNELAHRQLIAVVEGRTILGRGVVLDLRPELGLLAVRLGLGPDAVAGLPPARGTIKVLGEDQVAAVQDGAKLLRQVAWWATALTLLLLAAAIGAARDRRLLVQRAGVGLALAAIAVLLTRRVGSRQLVDRLTDDGPSAAAGRATLRISTEFLAHLALLVGTLGLWIALIAWLAGPAARALATRQRLVPLIDRHRLAAHGLVAAAVLGSLTLGLLPWSENPVADLLYLIAGALAVEALHRAPAHPLPA